MDEICVNKYDAGGGGARAMMYFLFYFYFYVPREIMYEFVCYRRTIHVGRKAGRQASKRGGGVRASLK